MSEFSLLFRNDSSKLAHMCKHGKESEVKQYLLKPSVDINYQGSSNEKASPIHKAVINGHINIVKLLIDTKADINLTNPDGDTPLHSACEKGYIEIVKLLLAAGAALTLKNKTKGDNPLHVATANGHVEIVKLLKEAGVYLNVQNNLGNTALHVAATNYNREIIEYLVNAGADTTHTNKQGRTAEDIAPQQFFEVMQVINLYNACEQGDFPKLSKLLQNKKLDVNRYYEAKEMNYPIIAAVANQHIKIAKQLIKSGADVNVKMSETNATALHFAASGRNSAMVKLLLSEGADVNITDKEGHDALFCATTSAVGNQTDILTMIMAAADGSFKEKYNPKGLSSASEDATSPASKDGIKLSASSGKGDGAGDNDERNPSPVLEN